MKKTIGIIVGSLRKESFSRKLAKNIIDLAPDGFEFTLVSLEDLPVYNQDFDDHNEVPASYSTFRNTIKSLDGIIFVTPEYNRSIPGVLKNALDIGSRPYGKNNWSGKPALIVSNSPGNLGGFGANHHLRQCLVFLDVPAVQQPELYIPGINKLLDENGHINNEDTRKLLEKAIKAYIDWFNKLS